MSIENKLEIDKLPLVFTGRIQDLLTPDQCPEAFFELNEHEETQGYLLAIRRRNEASKRAGSTALNSEIQK